jgi:hypothetical protein
MLYFSPQDKAFLLCCTGHQHMPNLPAYLKVHEIIDGGA